MTVLLADGVDAQLWVYLIFAAISVVGAILGKKQKEREQRQRTARPGGRPAARPRVSPPPIQRPASQMPPARPRVSAPPVPSAPPTQPQPTTTIPRPVEARPTGVAPSAGRPREIPEPPVEAELEPIVVETEPGKQAPVPTTSGKAPELPKTRRPSRFVGDHAIQAMLRDKSGLRTAFVLSEILGPPVALR